jgi:hypothetical protein
MLSKPAVVLDVIRAAAKASQQPAAARLTLPDFGDAPRPEARA